MPLIARCCCDASTVTCSRLTISCSPKIRRGESSARPCVGFIGPTQSANYAAVFAQSSAEVRRTTSRPEVVLGIRIRSLLGEVPTQAAERQGSCSNFSASCHHDDHFGRDGRDAKEIRVRSGVRKKFEFILTIRRFSACTGTTAVRQVVCFAATFFHINSLIFRVILDVAATIGCADMMTAQPR